MNNFYMDYCTHIIETAAEYSKYSESMVEEQVFKDLDMAVNSLSEAFVSLAAAVMVSNNSEARTIYERLLGAFMKTTEVLGEEMREGTKEFTELKES